MYVCMYACEWFRSYLYEAAVDATLQVVKDKSISNKSYLQMKVNYPEVRSYPVAQFPTIN